MPTKRRTEEETPLPSIADGDKVEAERFRTKMCRNFAEKGSCPYEARCMFAHGRHQLRTKQKNLSDGLVSEEAIRQFKRGLATKAKPRTNASTLILSLVAPAMGQDSCGISEPSPRNSTPPSEHANGHPVHLSLVPDESELRTFPELPLRSPSWYRRNPYDWNNTIVLIPSPVSRGLPSAIPLKARTRRTDHLSRSILTCLDASLSLLPP